MLCADSFPLEYGGSIIYNNNNLTDEKENAAYEHFGSFILHGENGSARRFAEEMESSGTAELIRREAWNEGYDYFFPRDDSETVLLIDRWRDQESLDIHHTSPMMDTITHLREKYDLHMRVERYVSDEQGIPFSDKKFIKE